MSSKLIKKVKKEVKEVKGAKKARRKIVKKVKAVEKAASHAGRISPTNFPKISGKGAYKMNQNNIAAMSGLKGKGGYLSDILSGVGNFAGSLLPFPSVASEIGSLLGKKAGDIGEGWIKGKGCYTTPTTGAPHLIPRFGPDGEMKNGVFTNCEKLCDIMSSYDSRITSCAINPGLLTSTQVIATNYNKYVPEGTMLTFITMYANIVSNTQLAAGKVALANQLDVSEAPPTSQDQIQRIDNYTIVDLKDGMTLIPVENKKKDNLAYNNYLIRNTESEQFASDGSSVPISLSDYCRVNISVDSTIKGSDNQKIGELWISTKTRFVDWEQTKALAPSKSSFHAYGQVFSGNITTAYWSSNNFPLYWNGPFNSTTYSSDTPVAQSICSNALPVKFGNDSAIPGQQCTAKVVDVSNLPDGFYSFSYKMVARVTQALYPGIAMRGYNSATNVGGTLNILDSSVSTLFVNSGVGDNLTSQLTYVNTFNSLNSTNAVVSAGSAWLATANVQQIGTDFPSGDRIFIFPINFTFRIARQPGNNGRLFLGNLNYANVFAGGISFTMNCVSTAGVSISWDLTITQLPANWNFDSAAFPLTDLYYPLSPPSFSSVSSMVSRTNGLTTQVDKLNDTIKVQQKVINKLVSKLSINIDSESSDSDNEEKCPFDHIIFCEKHPKCIKSTTLQRWKFINARCPHPDGGPPCFLDSNDEDTPRQPYIQPQPSSFEKDSWICRAFPKDNHYYTTTPDQCFQDGSTYRKPPDQIVFKTIDFTKIDENMFLDVVNYNNESQSQAKSRRNLLSTEFNMKFQNSLAYYTNFTQIPGEIWNQYQQRQHDIEVYNKAHPYDLPSDPEIVEEPSSTLANLSKSTLLRVVEQALKK